MKTILYPPFAILVLALAGCTVPNVNDNTPHTTIRGSIAGQPFCVENHKDTILDGLEVSATPKGAATIRIQHLATVMNPTNIANTGDAGEKLIRANGEAIVNAIHASGDLSEKLGGAAGTAAKATLFP